MLAAHDDRSTGGDDGNEAAEATRPFHPTVGLVVVKHHRRSMGSAPPAAGTLVPTQKTLPGGGQQQDSPEAQVGAAVGVGDGRDGHLARSRGAQPGEVPTWEDSQRCHHFEAPLKSRLSPGQASLCEARAKMGERKARPHRPNRALHAQFSRPASCEA